MYNDIDDDYYKPKRINIAFESDYIEYETNEDTNKNLSIKEYLNMIRQYLSDIINDHKDEWKFNFKN